MKPVTFGVFFDQVPCFVGHLHLDQHIAREKFPFAEIFLACFHLDDFFHRNEYLPELVQHSSAADSLLQRTLHTLLETGVGMNHIPLLIHHPSCPMRYFTASSRPASIIHRNMAITRTKAKTIPVVCTVSFRFGHTTFLVSSHDSLLNA